MVVNKIVHTVSEVVEKRMLRDFARDFGLVYFGNLHARHDEYEMVRGVTVHTNHRDKHFMVGNYRGYDVTALQRHVTLMHPQHGTNKYKWTLLQADLHYRRLPHVLITASHHDKLFLDNVQIKLAKFQQLNPMLIPNQHFATHFQVFAATDNFDALPSILTPEIMMVMLRHFKHFDVEMFDDQVIVYTSQARISQPILRELLREALWLAEQLDGPAQQKTPEA